ncbi:hypothetical protein [Glaciihabitans sp. UYNi722]|uniref:hypothetical protein n=1 Tax=Glaciihabitans sp. UYNi722 TaxID=3156344 RepID=UPI003395FFDD
MKQHLRFAAHQAFVSEHGLNAVLDAARSHELPFTKDPRVGPWVTVLRTDAEFAQQYIGLEVDRYQAVVAGIARTMFDRDTVPGVEPEDLMQLDIPALIIPGADDSHAPSAAHFLRECLREAQLWDVPVAEQTASTVGPRVLEFLAESSKTTR